MKRILERFDKLAEPTPENRTAAWLERIAFAFLVLMTLAAPHSIAATQIAWLTGMFVWLVRLLFKPRIRFRLTWLDAALWGLFGWSFISAIFSYDPLTSFDKLRTVALFLIFYFVFYNIKNLRAAYFLAFALIFSCMINVAWTPLQKWIGRGVEIHGVNPNGPLGKAGLVEGDTLDRADGKKIATPEDALALIGYNETTVLEFYRGDFETDAKIQRADILIADDAKDRLGIDTWTVGRIIRASGFYRHYVTYAEALQLVASLVFGLFVAAFSLKQGKLSYEIQVAGFKIPAWTILLIVFGCMGLVLLMTITRASQLGLMVSGLVILIASGKRKLLLAAMVVALPVMIAGFIYLQQQRHVGLLDARDESTQYRRMMWRDGYRLWTQDARNFIFGVGMDSIKSHWQEWDMFEGGRWPVSHFHSTPVQLLVERGLPALLIWLAVLGIYAQILWRGSRRFTIGEYSDPRSAVHEPQWPSAGILLGCLGGAIGFFTSGLVHYNLGDSVVAMIFFFLMGLGTRVADLLRRSEDDAAPAEVAVKLAA
jgi:hypothetical protein